MKTKSLLLIAILFSVICFSQNTIKIEVVDNSFKYTPDTGTTLSHPSSEIFANTLDNGNISIRVVSGDPMGFSFDGRFIGWPYTIFRKSDDGTFLNAAEVQAWFDANTGAVPGGGAATTDASDLTTGVLADARVQASNVEQHLSEIYVSDGTVASVNSALTTANGKPVRITAPITAAATPINVPSNSILYIDYPITTGATFTGEAVIYSLNTTNVKIIGDAVIDGAAATTSVFDAVKFDGVTGGLIEGLTAKNVEITASATETGNFAVIDSDTITVRKPKVYGTFRMGVYFNGGKGNKLEGGYINDTNDSGVGVVSSQGFVMTGTELSKVGTSGASAITIDATDAIIDNVRSIGDSTLVGANKNGITIGHEGFPATNSIITNSIFSGHTIGILVQGTGTENITISDNNITNNGTGIRLLTPVSKITMTDNYLGNSLDYNFDNGLSGITSKGNIPFTLRSFELIKPDYTTNLWDNADLKFRRIDQNANSYNGLTFSASTTQGYGPGLFGRRNSGGTDFDLVFGAFENKVFTETMTIDQDGAINATGVITANAFIGDVAASTFDASAMVGNLAVTDDTVQELANVVDGLTGSVTVIDDDTFATATASNVPSAESVKAYHDANSGGTSLIVEAAQVTGTTYTLQATDNNKIIPFNNVSDITVSAQASPVTGFNTTFFQANTGKASTDFTVKLSSLTEAGARTNGEGNYMTIRYNGTNWYRTSGEGYNLAAFGPEVLLDPELDGGSAQWSELNTDATHTITYSAGEMTMTADTNGSLQWREWDALTIGVTYRLRIEVTDMTGTGNLITNSFDSGSIIQITNGVGVYDFTGVASNVHLQIFPEAAGDVNITVTSVSVKEVL